MGTVKDLQPEYVSPDQAGRMTSLSPWTWRRWAYDGKVASVKVSTRLLIPIDEIRRVMGENTRPRLVADSQEAAA